MAPGPAPGAMLALVLGLLLAAAQCSRAASPSNWTRIPEFFCHPDVDNGRLHKNSTLAACLQLCEHDPACVSVAFTNQNVPALSWCFAPEDACPNKSGKCRGCENWDTYVRPGAGPFPPADLFNLSQAISSSMVLQQAPAKAQLWGWGVPGTEITVTMGPGGFTATTVDKDGAWLVALPPQKAGPAFGTGNITLSAQSTGGHNTTIVLTDVLFGEVWLCTGQSNMGVTLAHLGSGPTGDEPLKSWSGEVTYGAAEIANSSAYPLVRVARQANLGSAVPVAQASTPGWFRPAPDNIGSFSAVCWFFATRLSLHLDVPIGVVQNQVGGTAVELWSSEAALGKCDQTRAGKMASCAGGTATHTASFPAAWQDEVDGVAGVKGADRNGTLYNGMMYPWLNMRTRGAIWYQGESNVACNDKWPYMQGVNCAMSPSACAGYYACQFPAMVADWRSSFAADGIPFTFLFVGLPAYVESLPSISYDNHTDTSLPLLRLAQGAASALPNTAQSSIIDHGYLFSRMGSIHPMDKLPVGRRLVLAAREHAYGESVVSTGPIAESATVAQGIVTVRFVAGSLGKGGLMLRTTGPRQECVAGQKQIAGQPTIPVPKTQCGPASGFQIGSDGAWHDVVGMRVGAGAASVLLDVPPALQQRAEREDGGSLTLRYLFADWPTPTVYAADSELGPLGELPTPPFILPVQG